MEPSEQAFEWLSADVLGWAVAATTIYLAIIAFLLRFRDKRAAALAALRRCQAAVCRRNLKFDWHMICGIIETSVDRVEAIARAQQAAALQVDAAEHALGLLLEDCAAVMSLPGRERPAPRLSPALLSQPVSPAVLMPEPLAA